jgi:hypothetical protein
LMLLDNYMILQISRWLLKESERRNFWKKREEFSYTTGEVRRTVHPG